MTAKSELLFLMFFFFTSDFHAIKLVFLYYKSTGEPIRMRNVLCRAVTCCPKDNTLYPHLLSQWERGGRGEGEKREAIINSLSLCLSCSGMPFLWRRQMRDNMLRNCVGKVLHYNLSILGLPILWVNGNISPFLFLPSSSFSSSSSPLPPLLFSSLLLFLSSCYGRD